MAGRKYWKKNRGTTVENARTWIHECSIRSTRVNVAQSDVSLTKSGRLLRAYSAGVRSAAIAAWICSLSATPASARSSPSCF